MHKNRLIIFIGALFLFTGLYAQNMEFTVKKPLAGFVYNGKPVSPEALIPFLPDLERGDTVLLGRVNLKELESKSRLMIDTIGSQIRYRSYYNGGSIAYQIAASISKNRYVLKVYESGGGSFTMPYVFIVKVEGNDLVKIGYFVPEPQYLDPSFTIEVNDNEIIDGTIRYKIPD